MPQRDCNLKRFFLRFSSDFSGQTPMGLGPPRHQSYKSIRLVETHWCNFMLYGRIGLIFHDSARMSKSHWSTFVTCDSTNHAWYSRCWNPAGWVTAARVLLQARPMLWPTMTSIKLDTLEERVKLFTLKFAHEEWRPLREERHTWPVQYGRFGGSRTGLFDPNRGFSTPPVPTD